ncbi:hypothetical protein A3844_00890 [Paenibacillus helianthi]|uniref:DUF4367 domain-containing protein n=1 Tax=Paenibacillus helianthi TaxID=1349432 RepID=A0ABX3EY84_9BACL|nr:MULTISPECIES: hypothetical protein [Paenibacillus]OKP91710.1 hypothetical protein A3844_00890 [Paenibacillus helianthi]OKP94056.1 hypothetical protein A3848_03235 [Paenibacillus sp. P32E]
MTNPLKYDSDKQLTNEAWAKLQNKLAAEPVNPVWASWGQDVKKIGIEEDHAASIAESSDRKNEVQPLVSPADTAGAQAKTNSRKPRRFAMNRRRKWATAAAGVAIFAAVLATPVGNTAMAAILGQFRMQEVTAVNEDDLRNLFYQVSGEDNINEAVNKFGSFSYSSGTLSGMVPVNALQDKLGYPALTGGAFDKVKSVYINSSQQITLTLKVDEVNKALTRLGAKELLPESIDGKPLTLSVPESVSYDFSMDDHWANLMQMNTPVVNVDPSINVEEAVRAVIDFPLLPDELKSSLQQSSILAGDLPMPVIKGNHTEQIEVNGIKIIMETMEYGDGPTYSATWVNNGQLFDFSGGSLYQDKEKFMKQLQELITQ